MIRKLAIILMLINFSQAQAHDEHHPELDQFYKSLKQPGTQQGCCNITDCKPVSARIQKDHWEVFIDEKTFPYDHGASPYMVNSPPPNDWVRVRDEVIIRDKPNEAGMPIACWYGGWVICFVPPAGV